MWEYFIQRPSNLTLMRRWNYWCKFATAAFASSTNGLVRKRSRYAIYIRQVDNQHEAWSMIAPPSGNDTTGCWELCEPIGTFTWVRSWVGVAGQEMTVCINRTILLSHEIFRSMGVCCSTFPSSSVLRKLKMRLISLQSYEYCTNTSTQNLWNEILKWLLVGDNVSIARRSTCDSIPFLLHLA